MAAFGSYFAHCQVTATLPVLPSANCACKCAGRPTLSTGVPWGTCTPSGATASTKETMVWIPGVDVGAMDALAVGVEVGCVSASGVDVGVPVG